MTTPAQYRYCKERRRRTGQGDMLPGFASGVMLTASFFSLAVPSLELSTERYGESTLPAAIAVASILIGFIIELFARVIS